MYKYEECEYVFYLKKETKTYKDHISIDIKHTLIGKTLVTFIMWIVLKKSAKNICRNKLIE